MEYFCEEDKSDFLEPGYKEKTEDYLKKVGPMFAKYGYWCPTEGLEQYPEYNPNYIKIDEGPYYSIQKILNVLRNELSTLEKVDTDEMDYDSDRYFIFGKIEECKTLIGMFEKL